MDVIQELYPNDKHNHKERADKAPGEAGAVLTSVGLQGPKRADT
jgi:transcriptional regulator of met regulon